MKNAKSVSGSEGNDEHKRDLGNGLFAIKTRKGPLLLRELGSSPTTTPRKRTQNSTAGLQELLLDPSRPKRQKHS